MSGDFTASAATDSIGRYAFDGLWYGLGLQVTPSVASIDIEAVSSLDASAVLGYLVQIETLTANQQIAADVSGDGSVSAEDASRILKMVVGGPGSLPTPLWRFVPESATIDSLPGTLLDLDFAGILRGDVTGNWCPTPPCALQSRGDLAWSGVGEWHDGQFEVTVGVADAGSRGLEFDLTYDSSKLRFLGVEVPSAGLWETSHTDGVVAVAGATAAPWTAGQPVVIARFEPARTPARRTQVEIESLRIDEGAWQSRTLQVPGLTATEAWIGFDLRVAPNPSRGSVTLSIQGAEGPLRIDIFDVAGRKVRTYAVTPDAAGARELVWDRHDGGGLNVADGMYFLRAVTDGRTVTKRVVLVR
jgi:hypothetical protein